MSWGVREGARVGGTSARPTTKSTSALVVHAVLSYAVLYNPPTHYPPPPDTPTCHVICMLQHNTTHIDAADGSCAHRLSTAQEGRHAPHARHDLAEEVGVI